MPDTNPLPADQKPLAEEALAALKKVAAFAKPFVVLQRFVEDITSAEQALAEANGRVSTAKAQEEDAKGALVVLTAQRDALNSEIATLRAGKSDAAASVLDKARTDAANIVGKARSDAQSIVVEAQNEANSLGVQAKAALSTRDKALAEQRTAENARDDAQAQVNAILASLSRK